MAKAYVFIKILTTAEEVRKQIHKLSNFGRITIELVVDGPYAYVITIESDSNFDLDEVIFTAREIEGAECTVCRVLDAFVI